MHDERLPGSHAVFDVVDFDTRYYKAAQLYEPEDAKTSRPTSAGSLKARLLTRRLGQPDFVISAGFTPADDAEFNAWYQEEHLAEVSGITGWRRTQRYVLTFARQNRKPASEKQIDEPPKFLTLVSEHVTLRRLCNRVSNTGKHFFDGEKLPEAELGKAGEGERTKRNMSSMKATQLAVFKKLSYYSK